MIFADRNIALWAILLSAAALGLWAEQTPKGGKPWAAVITIIIAWLLSNLGLIRAADPAYDIVWSYFMPLAVPLLLSKADLRRLLPSSISTLLAFSCGVLGVAIGAALAYYIFPLGLDDWKIAAIYCAQYIGGYSAGVATKLQSEDFLAATVAANNLVTPLYILLLFALPAINKRIGLFPDKDSNSLSGSLGKLGFGSFFRRSELSIHTWAIGLAASAIISAIGYSFASWLGIPGSGLLLVTVLVLVGIKLFPTWIDRIAGIEEMGILCLQLLFATIGARANPAGVSDPRLLTFASLIVIVHLTVIMVAGKICRWDLSEIIVASSASITGPVIGMAIAVARGWYHLVIPAIIWGTLGSAVATSLALQLGKLLLL